MILYIPIIHVCMCVCLCVIKYRWWYVIKQCALEKNDIKGPCYVFNEHDIII